MKLSDLDMCAYFSHAYDIDVYIPKIKVLNYPMPDMGGNWLLFTNETLFIEGYTGNLCVTCIVFNSFMTGKFKKNDIHKSNKRYVMQERKNRGSI